LLLAWGSVRLLRSPKLGILNFKGGSALQIQAADRSAVERFFSSTVESTSVVPSCDVLFIYCDFDADGNVVGTTLQFREIVRDSCAAVAVVASENPGENIFKAGKPTGYGQANLVFTLNRKGQGFEIFYQRLFEQMANGTSMPVAWNKLAPQIPGMEHPDGPHCLLICEVAFEPMMKAGV
jgi:hypothetical protein